MLGIGKWLGREESAGIELGGISLGDNPWLVLGGGGVRGLAHLGALEVLFRAGLEPSGILGASAGSLIGACVAAGLSVQDLQSEALTLRKSDVAHMPRRVLWAGGIRAPALYRGDVLRSFLARLLPDDGWEALRVRFQANAVELGTGRMEWFGIGARTDVPLKEAIYASAALPVFYPPWPLPGGIYVDGGTIDALPIRRAAELGATGVVAIDVAAGPGADAVQVVEQGMLAIHERVFSIMAGANRKRVLTEWDGPPLLYVRPRVDRYKTMGFDRLDLLIQEGRDAAERALSSAVSAE